MTVFKLDPARICRSHGHKWIKPNPNSSYYNNPGNKKTRQCSRCKTWEYDSTQ